MKFSPLTTSALLVSLSAPALADPTLGFGLSFAFGGGKAETGVGVRMFSNDEQDQFAASIGLDYLIQSKRLRPTVGAAYLGDNSYIGLDLGFGLNGEGFDFGFSAGAIKTLAPPPTGCPVGTTPGPDGGCTGA